MRKINYSLTVILMAITAFVSSTMISCGGKAEEKNSDTTAHDSATAYTIAPELQTLIAKFKEHQEWPYKVDTTLLNMENKLVGDSLTSAEVAMLGAKWFKHDLVSGVEWELSSFSKIDSIKAAGKYKEYCDEMEPGETKTSNAYAVNKLMLDKDTWILVWALRNGSYEACPYSNTSAIYFTVIYKGQIGESFIMGEIEVAGDPPASLEKEIRSTFDKEGNLVLEDEEEGSDDGEQLESEKDHFEFKLVQGKLEKVKEEIGKKVMTKIEQDK